MIVNDDFFFTDIFSYYYWSKTNQEFGPADTTSHF